MELNWITGKCFWKSFLRLIHPEDHPQRIQSDDVQRIGEAVPGAGRMWSIHTSEDRLHQGIIPMPTKPWTTGSAMPVEVPLNYLTEQQRQQISEFKFNKFPLISLIHNIASDGKSVQVDT